MRPVLVSIAIISALAAGAASAQSRACIARVDGQDIVISPGAIVDGSDAGLRERFLRWPGALWDRAWGDPVACDSSVLITFIAGLDGLPEIEAARLCLAPLPGEEGYLLVPGPRNFRGLCATTVCDRINMTAADTAVVAATVIDVLDRPLGTVTGTARGSGALLLRGSSGALAHALDGASAELAAVLASPVGLATLLAAGGVLYYCGD